MYDFEIIARALLGILLLVIFFGVPIWEWRWWHKRKYRLHLSTILIAMLLAGALLALNFRPAEGWSFHGMKQGENLDFKYYLGWPALVLRPQFWNLYNGPDDPPVDFWTGVVLNSYIALNALSLTAMALERWTEGKRR